jgi:hypothetical protein
MTLQLVLVALLGLAAAVYLGRQAWRTWAGGCSAGCCKNGAAPASPPPLISQDDLVARVRRRSSGG